MPTTIPSAVYANNCLFKTTSWTFRPITQVMGPHRRARCVVRTAPATPVVDADLPGAADHKLRRAGRFLHMLDVRREPVPQRTCPPQRAGALVSPITGVEGPVAKR
jgi:hypothetical protein